MIELLSNYQWWLSVLFLSVLEIVLAIDNLVYLVVVSGRVEDPVKAKQARRAGILAAAMMRILFLSLLFVMSRLASDLFTVFEMGISVRDLILFFGGLLLIYSSISEIASLFQHSSQDENQQNKKRRSKHIPMLRAVILIMLMDVVFSIDSVITAIGITDFLSAMIIAILISALVILYFSETVTRIITTYPSIKTLALCILFLIGLFLVLAALDIQIAKSYLYFALGFCIVAEVINIKTGSRNSINPKTEDGKD